MNLKKIKNTKSKNYKIQNKLFKTKKKRKIVYKLL